MSSLNLCADQTTESIPFMDLSALHAPIQKEIEGRISRLAASSSFVLGPAVEDFEKSFAGYCDTRFAVGCSSGTSAVHMALAALGIGPGDEVITVSHTFIGTVWGILYCGATPVFADIRSDTMNIDVERLESLLTPRTKAIVPVHLYGQPVDMDPILKLAQKHNLYVIEDAAQAHGATYKNRRVGSLGHMACFSFYPGKNLGAWGEAGAVVTSDHKLAGRLRKLRDHGQPQRYQHDEMGYNYRMDAIQAAVLDVKLNHLDQWNSQRRSLAGIYSSMLDHPGVRLPVCGPDVEHVFHLFVIRVRNRELIRRTLEQRGITTGLHYPVPVHRQPVIVQKGFSGTGLVETETAASECLSLPLYPGMKPAHQQRVCDELLDIMASL